MYTTAIRPPVRTENGRRAPARSAMILPARTLSTRKTIGRLISDLYYKSLRYQIRCLRLFFNRKAAVRYLLPDGQRRPAGGQRAARMPLCLCTIDMVRICIFRLTADTAGCGERTVPPPLPFWIPACNQGWPAGVFAAFVFAGFGVPWGAKGL